MADYQAYGDSEIYNQFCKGVSKKSLADSIYFQEHESNKKYKRIEALTKVEQVILDNYLKTNR